MSDAVLADWLLVTRLGLAAILMFAAAAKSRDRAGFSTSLEGFGVPEGLAPLLAVVVPVAEGAVAVLLLPAATAPWGSAAATALLLGFTVVVGLTLARGLRPSCGCFGPLSADVIGPRTLARNLALTVAAAFAWLVGPGPGPAEWWLQLPGEGKRLAALGVPLVVGVVALAVLVRAQHRRIGDLTRGLERLRRMYGPAEGHSPGSPAPQFALPSLAGETVSLDELVGRDRSVTLVFLTPGCRHCADIQTDLAALQDRLDIVVISKRDRVESHGVAPVRVLLQEAWEIGERYRCEAVPSAVVVGPGPWIASFPVSGASAVRTLLADLLVERRVPDWAVEREGD